MDSAHGSAVARLATAVRAVPNSAPTLQNWVRSGVIETILLALAQHLKEAGGLDLKECFVDGTFVPPKKEAFGGKNQARQGHQDHGHCRRPRSSSRLADRKC